jgi:hypothetical protein
MSTETSAFLFQCNFIRIIEVNNYIQVNKLTSAYVIYIKLYFKLTLLIPSLKRNCRCLVYTVPRRKHAAFPLQKLVFSCEIAYLRHGWTELFRFMGYYEAWDGLKPTFRDYLSVPSLRTKNKLLVGIMWSMWLWCGQNVERVSAKRLWL